MNAHFKHFNWELAVPSTTPCLYRAGSIMPPEVWSYPAEEAYIAWVPFRKKQKAVTPDLILPDEYFGLNYAEDDLNECFSYDELGDLIKLLSRFSLFKEHRIHKKALPIKSHMGEVALYWHHFGEYFEMSLKEIFTPPIFDSHFNGEMNDVIGIIKNFEK